jgi:hypothetical protein
MGHELIVFIVIIAVIVGSLRWFNQVKNNDSKLYIILFGISVLANGIIYYLFNRNPSDPLAISGIIVFVLSVLLFFKTTLLEKQSR